MAWIELKPEGAGPIQPGAPTPQENRAAASS